MRRQKKPKKTQPPSQQPKPDFEPEPKRGGLSEEGYCAMSVAVRLIALSLAVVAGCDNRGPSPSAERPPSSPASQQVAVPSPATVPLIQGDPAASFKEFAVKFVAEMDKTYGRTFEPLPPKLDVRKTDSLVHPIVGTLDLSYKKTSSGNGTIGWSVKTSTFTFVIENDKWVIQSAKGDSILYDKAGNPMAPPVEGDDALGRTVTAARFAPMPDVSFATQIAEGLQK